jgi:hypothetical protein
MSYGGRFFLINSILSNLDMFMLSFYEVPKEARHKVDFYRSRFFWQGDDHKKSIGLLNEVLFVDRRIKEDWEY